MERNLFQQWKICPYVFCIFGMIGCFNHKATQWQYQLVMKKLQAEGIYAYTFPTQFCNPALLNYRKVSDI